MKNKIEQKSNPEVQVLGFRFQNRGFTLIEILIASTIFVLLISIVTGIFLGVVAAQRKTVAVRTLQDSIRYAIEAMSRDVRTGYDFSLFQNELRFTSTIGGGIQQVSYRLNGSVLEKGISDGMGGYTFSALTPGNLTIDYLNFYLAGESLGDQRQPRITVTLGATAGQGVQETKINVQTTLSQRELQS
jgi:prepilin-type N-terminal cleavage/methylation domain-containing protein